jgi:hypothetical protein
MILITKILLGIEERARKFFERFPFMQAFIAGVGITLFWRGVWHGFDEWEVSSLTSIIIGTLLLGGVGVFIQTMIGNTIIIKKVKQEENLEKKAIKKIEGEIVTEEVTLAELSAKLDQLIAQSKKD